MMIKNISQMNIFIIIFSGSVKFNEMIIYIYDLEYEFNK